MLFWEIDEEVRVVLVVALLFKNILFDFVRVKHIFLFFFDLVAHIDGLVHDTNHVLVVFLDELLLGSICVDGSLLLRCLGFVLINYFITHNFI
mgnify:CR=1 FL=1